MSQSANDTVAALAAGLNILQSHLQSQAPDLQDNPDIPHQLASLEIDQLALQALADRLVSEPPAKTAALTKMLLLGCRRLQRHQAELARNLLGYYALVDEPLGSNEPSVVSAPVLLRLAQLPYGDIGEGEDDNMRQQLANSLQLAGGGPHHETPS